MKMKLTKNTQIALIVVGLLAYAAGGYFMLIKKQGAKVEKLTAETAAVEAQITQARSAAKPKGKVEPIRYADLFRLSKAMPDQTDMAGVLLELNKIARDSGIVFDSIAPSQPQAMGEFSLVPIEVVFLGNFYDLTDFLFRSRTLVGVRDGELDARGRLFNVDTIEFAEGESHFPNIRATLRMEAYVFGNGVPAAPVTPAPTDTTAAPAPTVPGTTTTVPTTDTPTPPVAPATDAPAGDATALGATP
jgi:hypothetical protein